MVPELKPCPFCGGAVQLESRPESYGYYPEMVYVRCGKCGYQLPGRDVMAWKQGKGHFSVRDEATADVVARWNMRAAQEEPR